MNLAVLDERGPDDSTLVGSFAHDDESADRTEVTAVHSLDALAAASAAAADATLVEKLRRDTRPVIPAPVARVKAASVTAPRRNVPPPAKSDVRALTPRIGPHRRSVPTRPNGFGATLLGTPPPPTESAVAMSSREREEEPATDRIEAPATERIEAPATERIEAPATERIERPMQPSLASRPPSPSFDDLRDLVGRAAHDLERRAAEPELADRPAPHHPAIPPPPIDMRASALRLEALAAAAPIQMADSSVLPQSRLSAPSEPSMSIPVYPLGPPSRVALEAQSGRGGAMTFVITAAFFVGYVARALFRWLVIAGVQIAEIGRELVETLVIEWRRASARARRRPPQEGSRGPAR